MVHTPFECDTFLTPIQTLANDKPTITTINTTVEGDSHSHSHSHSDSNNSPRFALEKPISECEEQEENGIRYQFLVYNRVQQEEEQQQL